MPGVFSNSLASSLLSVTVCTSYRFGPVGNATCNPERPLGITYSWNKYAMNADREMARIAIPSNSLTSSIPIFYPHSSFGGTSVGVALLELISSSNSSTKVSKATPALWSPFLARMDTVLLFASSSPRINM